MYFLGHMAWAYVLAMLAWAFIPGVKRTGKLFIPLILLLGILPDADLFFSHLGIVHHTVTHSFLFWIIVFAPVFFRYRLKAVPYFVAVVQHFAFGDLLMGSGVMLFWPFNSSFIGLHFGMPSLVDSILETAGLIIALGIMFHVGDLKRIFSVDRRNRYMLIPLLALLASALSLTVQVGGIASFFNYDRLSSLILVLGIAHLILISVLAISTIQGYRAPQKNENSGSIPTGGPNAVVA